MSTTFLVVAVFVVLALDDVRVVGCWRWHWHRMAVGSFLVVAIRGASVIPAKIASNSYMQPKPEQLASSSLARSPLPPSPSSPSSAIACYCQPLVATSSIMVTLIITVPTDNFVVAATAIVVIATVISVIATVDPVDMGCVVGITIQQQ